MDQLQNNYFMNEMSVAEMIVSLIATITEHPSPRLHCTVYTDDENDN